MSQQELDRTDQEVMELVNGAAAADAKKNAEKIADAVQNPAPAYAEEEMECEAFVCKKRWRYILCIAACVAIALILVVLLFVPEIITWVVNLGVSICCSVAAVCVDRFRRWN